MSWLIHKIFENQLSPKQQLHEYATKLIAHQFSNKRKFKMDYTFAKTNQALIWFDLFCYTKYEWIKINSITKVFPNLEQISIDQIHVSDAIVEYILYDCVQMRDNSKLFKYYQVPQVH